MDTSITNTGDFNIEISPMLEDYPSELYEFNEENIPQPCLKYIKFYIRKFDTLKEWKLAFMWNYIPGVKFQLIDQDPLTYQLTSYYWLNLLTTLGCSDPQPVTEGFNYNNCIEKDYFRYLPNQGVSNYLTNRSAHCRLHALVFVSNDPTFKITLVDIGGKKFKNIKKYKDNHIDHHYIFVVDCKDLFLKHPSKTPISIKGINIPYPLYYWIFYVDMHY